jgi:hypothetical protein
VTTRFCTINEVIVDEGHINAGFRKLERERPAKAWLRGPETWYAGRATSWNSATDGLRHRSISSHVGMAGSLWATEVAHDGKRKPAVFRDSQWQCEQLLLLVLAVPCTEPQHGPVPTGRQAKDRLIAPTGSIGKLGREYL